MTAVFALIVLLRISVFMTTVAFGDPGGFRLRAEQSHRHDAADFSGAIQAERRGHRAADGIARRACAW